MVGKSEVTFFNVQVSLQSPLGRTTNRVVLRRFSQFMKLHGALKARYPKSSVPDAPSKQRLTKVKTDSALINERRKDLESWLRAVMEDLALSRSTLVADFLDLPGIANLAAASAMSWQIRSEDELEAAISSAVVSEHQQYQTHEQQVAALLAAAVEAEALTAAESEAFGGENYSSGSAPPGASPGEYRRYSDSDDLSDSDRSSLRSESAPHTTPDFHADKGKAPPLPVSQSSHDATPPRPVQQQRSFSELHFDGLSSAPPAQVSEVDPDPPAQQTAQLPINAMMDNLWTGKEEEADHPKQLDNALKTKLDEAEHHIQNLMSRIECEEATKELLETQLSEKEDELRALQSSIDTKIQEGVDSTERACAELKVALEEMRQEKLDLEAQVQELADAENVKRAEISELHQKLKNSNAELSNLQAEVFDTCFKLLGCTKTDNPVLQAKESKQALEKAEGERKMERKVLTKEVKSLSRSLAAMEERLTLSSSDRERIEAELGALEQEKEKISSDALSFLKESQTLLEQLSESSLEKLLKDEGAQSASAMEDEEFVQELVHRSDMRIGVILSTAQLLESGVEGGAWPLVSEDFANVHAGLQKMIASILKQNAELRRRNNNLLRYSLSAAKTGATPLVPSDMSDAGYSRQAMLTKFLAEDIAEPGSPVQKI
eukprot:scaffold569_cov408-Prasinococcus_capsulatus_cf.AAC.32